MESRKQLRPYLVLLLALGCSHPKLIDPDIVRPEPGKPFLEKLPGPMLGSFESYSDALLAACNKIIKKPNAVAGRRDDQNFNTFWRVSNEYCAWIYYTPDHKYVISKLTDQSEVDPLHRTKSCFLPSLVEDQRYPADSIEYIYALHNHPQGSSISEKDIRFIVSEAVKHGFESATKDGPLRLSIVAFFSNRVSPPMCDGFHQYIPATNQILRWTKTQSRWTCEQTGLVTWDDDKINFSINQTSSACFDGGAP